MHTVEFISAHWLEHSALVAIQRQPRCFVTAGRWKSNGGCRPGERPTWNCCSSPYFRHRPASGTGIRREFLQLADHYDPHQA